MVMPVKDNILIDKSIAFAARIIKLNQYLVQSKKESVISKQIVRSGTSIGANIREAFYAHSRADFIAKLHIALKECAESEYWLELLIEGGYCADKAVLEHCSELKRLLIASLNTAKGKQQP